MSKVGHLEKIKVKLEIKTPTFIGEGVEYTKKEYIYNSKNQIVHIPDTFKIIAFLKKNKLVDDFEKYMLQNKNNLMDFLCQNNIRESEYKEFISYSFYAGDALDDKHSISGIKSFIKDSYGCPYIPGSSIKGALRTVILAKLIKEKNIKFDVDAYINEVRNYGGKKKILLKRETDSIENQCFNVLGYTDNNRDAVNSIMKGLMVSDSSKALVEDLVLCKKMDILKSGNVKSQNIARESLKPGTVLYFDMTLEHSILEKLGIDKNFIMDAIEQFSEAYISDFENMFEKGTVDFIKNSEKSIIHIGGGVGFPTKTINNSLGDNYNKLQLTAGILKFIFPNHFHENDVKNGISPHTLKCTKYEGKIYPIGKCTVTYV